MFLFGQVLRPEAIRELFVAIDVYMLLLNPDCVILVMDVVKRDALHNIWSAVLLIFAIPVCLRWNPTDIVACISIIAKNNEHFHDTFLSHLSILL